MIVKLEEVCKRIYAGGDVPKDRYSEEKTEDYKVPIFANAEKDEGLYGYTDEAREKELSITVAARGTIGYTAIRREPFLPVVRLITVVPDLEKVSERYLFYALKKCKPQSSGTSIPQLTVPDIKKNTINLLDIAEQESIANRLDKLNGIIKLRKEVISKLDELIRARFVEMFGDPVRNTKKWNTEKLHIVAPINKYKGNVDVVDGKVWLLNLDMIESYTGNILDISYEYENKMTSSTIKFDENCVLYSKLRPYLNKVVIPEMRGYATSELISMGTEKINKYFLANLLRQDSFVDFSNSTSYGAKMPRASIDEIKNFNLIMPPRELQNEFATFVEQVNKSKVEVQKALDKAQLLFDSLMQKYFG
ncbi:MAG: restriction endonuclease subunit S [Lachnoanaerobaculum saburreum]